jgi:transcriptional regulator with XRE-family HTH domain
MGSAERKARDDAFDELMASVNPAFGLRREMVEARKRAGLSQRELARRMGTAQSVITRLELGERSPNIKTLRKMAEVTGSRLVIRLESAKP